MSDKNILLFGGTFNPIHNGHLIIARQILETVRKDLDVDKVHLIPNSNAPHKEGMASAKQRLKMCHLAVDGDPLFEVSDFEFKRKEVSFTIDTVDYYLKQAENVYWIIGPDNLPEIPTWHRAIELVERCQFIVGYAPQSNIFENMYPCEPYYLEVWNQLYPYKNTPVYDRMTAQFVEIPHSDIRSTIIRERLKNGLPITYMVPMEVELFILQNGLYQCPKT